MNFAPFWPPVASEACADRDKLSLEQENRKHKLGGVVRSSIQTLMWHDMLIWFSARSSPCISLFCITCRLGSPWTWSNLICILLLPHSDVSLLWFPTHSTRPHGQSSSDPASPVLFKYIRPFDQDPPAATIWPGTSATAGGRGRSTRYQKIFHVQCSSFHCHFFTQCWSLQTLDSSSLFTLNFGEPLSLCSTPFNKFSRIVCEVHLSDLVRRDKTQQRFAPGRIKIQD